MADYLAIHHNAFVCDMHCDAPMKMFRGSSVSERNENGHVDIPRLKEGGVNLQVFACYIDSRSPSGQYRSTADRMIDEIESQFQTCQIEISICRSASDAFEAFDSGRIAAAIGIENCMAIENRLDGIKHFYDRGIRIMTLVHTVSSDWCISSGDGAPRFDGLTDFGRDVIRSMNQLGMIIDVSHASPSAVEKVLETSSSPVIASHSCVHAICPHDRNLTDDQIRSIASAGGVIGINFFVAYLARGNRWFKIVDTIAERHKDKLDTISSKCNDDPDEMYAALLSIYPQLEVETRALGIDVSTVVDHIDHVVNLVGTDHVGLGSDFDGAGKMPDGLEDCSQIPNITRELLSRGYSPDDTAKIVGGNFMRVFEKVCNKSDYEAS